MRPRSRRHPCRRPARASASVHPAACVLLSQNAVVFQTYGEASRRLQGLNGSTGPLSYTQVFAAGTTLFCLSVLSCNSTREAVPSVTPCPCYRISEAANRFLKMCFAGRAVFAGLFHGRVRMLTPMRHLFHGLLVRRVVTGLYLSMGFLFAAQ
jgi:hypothetical protein